MKGLLESKFKIGDIVSFENSSSFNPAYNVTTIGTITAIHFYKGKGMLVSEDKRGQFCYDVNGHSQVHMVESAFTLIKAAPQENKE